jgi:hypothetical protein
LAIEGPLENSDVPGALNTEKSAVLGQRFLSKYNFVGIIDRVNNVVNTAIQNGDKDDILKQFYTLAYIILIIIVLLLILLSYLVWLRSKRIKSEVWLTNHQDEIVQYAMCRKS